MIRILNIGPNEYRHWLTYEGEYLTEAFMREPDVEVQAWGRFRERYEPGLRLPEVVERLFSGKWPDVILFDTSLIRSDVVEDRSFTADLKEAASKSFLVYRTSDPWRFRPYFSEWIEKFNAPVWLVHSERYTDLMNAELRGTGSQAYMFPYFLGRRYSDLGLERVFDLGMIGRCEITIDGIPQTLKPKFIQKHAGKRKLKVFSEPPLSVVRRKLSREKYLDRYSKLILNLNQCFSSWNSPVRPKGETFPHTPCRYIEAPACGAITVTPQQYDELNRYYFPRDAYVFCEGSMEKAVQEIARLREDDEAAHRLRTKAYKTAMSNHQAENRAKFILGLLNGRGRETMNCRDFYGVPLA